MTNSNRQGSRLQNRRNQQQTSQSGNRRKVRTGNNQADSNRPEFKNFNEKDKAPRGSSLSHVGDLIAKLKRICLDKNTWMLIGYTGAGFCLCVSIAGYLRVLNPVFEAATGGFGFFPAAIASVVIASAVQYLQIAPRLPKYAPDIADELAYKLGLQRFVNPKESDSSPSLLPRAKEWARTAHDRGQRAAEMRSWLLYAVEFLGGFLAFPVLSATGVLNIGSLMMIFLATFGFESALWLGNWAEQTRLTGRESQKYRLQKKQLRQVADRDMN